MTEEQYWDKDCMLVKYYREAEEMRREKFNQEAWLQGMYIYDAIMRLSPILHAFAKKGTKPQPYVDSPYPISQAGMEEAKTMLRDIGFKEYMLLGDHGFYPVSL